MNCYGNLLLYTCSNANSCTLLVLFSVGQAPEKNLYSQLPYLTYSIKRTESFVKPFRPGATRGHSGAVPPQMTAYAPPNEHCAPPSEDCAPKKLTGSGILECESRPETPKLMFTSRIFVIFVDSHRISWNFCWDEDLFFWSSLKNSWKIARILRR